MSWTVSASGTTTPSIGVEQTLATDTTNGTYVLFASGFNLAAGEIAELKIYSAVLNGGTERVAWCGSLVGGLLTAPHVCSPPLPSDQSMHATLTQQNGVARAFNWKLLRTVSGSAGGGYPPGGLAGQVQFNSSGAFAGFTVVGDGSLDTSTGTLTVTKTAGVAFAPSATTDTTNASNLSSGTLPAARLPAATTGALGGVKPDGTTITVSSGVITSTTGILHNLTTATSMASSDLLAAVVSGADKQITLANVIQSIFSPITTQTGNYTLAQGDHNSTILYNSTSNTNTLTLPPALTVGTTVQIIQTNTGVWNFAAGAGMTVGNVTGGTVTSGQYAIVQAKLVSSSLWIICGATA